MVFVDDDYPDLQVHTVESRLEASESDSMLKFVISHKSEYKRCWVSRSDNKTLYGVRMPITGDRSVEIRDAIVGSFNTILGMLSHLPDLVPFITSDECRMLTTMILTRALRIIKETNNDLEHKSLHLDVEIRYDVTCLLDESDIRMIEEYKTSYNGFVPASESSIADLIDRATMTADVDHRDSCPICLVEFTQGSLVTTMDCSHVFHHKCIMKWLKIRSHCCPMCRFELPNCIYERWFLRHIPPESYIYDE